ncbi:hypothetical protein HXX01_03115 [Candidatus Nomurabacteria bacterium]|nr:hypothetical protein [Candidatus Nomurabacteria bacterium]
MNKNILKKVFAIVLMLVIIFQAYFISEKVMATGVSQPDNVIVTLTVDEGITISDGANVTMVPNIGVASNGSIGSSSWIVRTNSTAGYTLAVKASTAPALKSGTNAFEDYTETVGGTPDLWSVPAGSKEFGYSAYGTDTPTATWGTSASCGAAGLPAVAQKYVGFSTSDKIIATRNTVTATTGVTTNICFAAEQDTIYAASGVYTATITATATTL